MCVGGCLSVCVCGGVFECVCVGGGCLSVCVWGV